MSMHYAVQQRLRMIDFLLANYGFVNRGALMDYYGISTPQASMDFRAYMDHCPGNMVYDGSRKTYVRMDDFKRMF